MKLMKYTGSLYLQLWKEHQSVYSGETSGPEREGAANNIDGSEVVTKVINSKSECRAALCTSNTPLANFLMAGCETVANMEFRNSWKPDAVLSMQNRYGTK